MHQPSSPSPAADAVESLLAGVLELDVEAQDRAVDALCDRQPQLATELRTRYTLFRRLLEVAAAPAPVESFGDFALIRPLGQGGMGVVWLARQRREGVDREVALKLVRQGALLSPDARERFRREARAAFRIEHPAICPVYDVGEVDGTPYIAMRYVAGRTLAELIAAARQSQRALALPQPASESSGTGSSGPVASEPRRSFDAVLALIETVARALHAAHEAGLVHRDVKPGNVMVTPTGEPVLLDFGLVREEDSDSSLTASGQPVGTPAYMAPEQISPAGRRIDRTTDVYGLGATLYECVTLVQPFRAETREDLYRQILTEDPTPARRLARNLPADLDAILETALRKEQDRRFATALDLADDLRALRSLQPIRARAAGPIQRARLWMRRNPLVTSALVLLAVAFGVAVWQAREANLRADEARRARALAEAGFQEARDSIDALTSTARDQLRDVPRFEGVRRALLERVIAFHDRFATLHTDDLELLAEVVHAWEAAAELQLELGDLDAAATSIDRARTAAARRVQIADSAAARDDLARLAQLAGVALLQRGEPAAAIGPLEESLAGYQALVRDRPGDARIAIAAAFVGQRLAAALHRVGRSEEALTMAAHSRGAIAVAESSGAVRLELLDARAGAAGLVARIERDLRRFDAAEPAFDEWVDTLRQVVRGNADDRANQHGLVCALLARARLFVRQQRHQDALADLDEALARLESLVEDFPDVRAYSGSLAVAWNNRYTVLRSLGRREEAAATLQRAKALAERNVELVPDDVESREALGRICFNLGNAERRANGPPAAIPFYQRAVDALGPLADANADELDYLRAAADAAESLALCCFLTEQPERADPLLERTRAWLAQLIERSPDDPRNRMRLARLRFNQGARCLEIADAHGAIQAFGDSLAMREALVEASPTNLRQHGDVLLTRSRLARARLLLEATEAGEFARDALRRYAALPAPVRDRLDDDTEARGSLATLWNVVGASDASDPAVAADSHRRARALLAPAIADSSVLGWDRVDALVAAVALTEYAHASGDQAGVRQHARDVIGILEPLQERALLGADLRREARGCCERFAALIDQLGLDQAAQDTLARVRDALVD